MQGQIDESTFIAGDFNTSYYKWTDPAGSTSGRTYLNSTVLDIVDIYRLLHPTTVDYASFLSSHGTFTNIDHILVHETNLKLKSIEYMQ